MLNTPGVRDVHEAVMDVHEFDALVNNTTKPFQLITFRGFQSVKAFIEMASMVVGSREELLKKPLFTVGPGGTCPLIRTKEQLDTLMFIAENRIPASLSGQPVAGGTSPATIAGNIIVGNAEILSGIVAFQMIRKGSPVYYLGISYAMDMRTGITATGSPERSILNLVIPQISRYYGIPCAVIANTDAPVSDAQSGSEKSFGILTSLQSQANLVWGVGGMGASMSCTQAIIDDEIIDMAKRIMEGFEISQDTLALDVIDAVGPGGNFLTQRHTKDYYMKEIISPIISNRLSRGAWEGKDTKQLSDKSKDFVKRILKTHEPEPLDKNIRKSLREYIIKRQKSIVK
jgi:trimethylamine--corrinoid protein Co-methyltransferase